MTTISETIPAALDGQRIDRVVAMISGLSRSEVVTLLGDGAVVVDGAAVSKASHRIQAGQTVTFELPQITEEPGPVPDPSVAFEIVHEDESIVVIDKPAGLVVHPGAGHPDATLVNGLLARFPELAGVGEGERPGIVHRLDRGTSGLLVVARTETARDSLVGQLGRRSVLRRYRTLVWGHPDSPSGLIDAPIGRSPRNPTKMAVTTDGREARTRYEVLRRFQDPAPTSLVTAELETGRTHQIRVHLAAIGHAVVGDDRYGGSRQNLPCPRPFLHAAELGFEHPRTGEHLRFHSELPGDLEAVLATLV